MKQQAYTKPLVEATKIETELFLCESLTINAASSDDDTKVIQESSSILSKQDSGFDLWEDE